MREILFRGKRLDNGEWGYGDFVRIQTKRGDSVAIRNVPEQVNSRYIGVIPDEVDPATVGQFTGLLDKNGNKIFEGDIVHCLSRTDSGNMVVIFEDGEFRMVLCEDYANYATGMGYYAIRCFVKEVIGTIHDNPELLGGAE